MRIIPDDALAIVTIYQEAAGEPYEGKLAVAEVIRNRMRRYYASDGTVAGTVLRAWQFSGWNTDAGVVRIRSLQIDTDDPVVQECERAWSESQQTAIVRGVVLYLNPQATLKQAGRLPAWAADPDNPAQIDPTRVVAKIGHHVFLSLPK